MGKNVLVAYMYPMSKDPTNGFGFGNAMIERDRPNCPLTISEIRQIEDNILADLHERGQKYITRVIAMNVIPLGDQEVADDSKRS